MRNRRTFTPRMLTVSYALARAFELASMAYAECLKIGFSQVTLQLPLYVQLNNVAEAPALAGHDVPAYIDAGTKSVTVDNVGDFFRGAL